MKTKTTKKTVYENYGKERCFSFGYCSIYYIGQLFDSMLYTCGVYGWNADIYLFRNFCLCTGYRPFGTDNEEVERICKEVNEKIKADNKYYEHPQMYIDELEERINKVLL